MNLSKNWREKSYTNVQKIEKKKKKRTSVLHLMRPTYTDIDTGQGHQENGKLLANLTHEHNAKILRKILTN